MLLVLLGAQDQCALLGLPRSHCWCSQTHCLHVSAHCLRKGSRSQKPSLGLSWTEGKCQSCVLSGSCFLLLPSSPRLLQASVLIPCSGSSSIPESLNVSLSFTPTCSHIHQFIQPGSEPRIPHIIHAGQALRHLSAPALPLPAFKSYFSL